MTDTLKDFTEKLNMLFEMKRKSDGSKYSQEDVIQGTNGVLTRAYLWKLRTGRAKNPGFTIVQALADFFDVNINYFRTDESQPEVIVEKSLRDKLLEEMSLRASMHSDDTIKAIISMMDYIEKNYPGGGKSKET
jgi:transcriptional regulator with XRE-family HTH domain